MFEQLLSLALENAAREYLMGATTLDALVGVAALYFGYRAYEGNDDKFQKFLGMALMVFGGLEVLSITRWLT
jgi:hypothetical protein